MKREVSFDITKAVNGGHIVDVQEKQRDGYTIPEHNGSYIANTNEELGAILSKIFLYGMGTGETVYLKIIKEGY